MNVDLIGRRAVVTGGGRGIGSALALGLARSGANLALAYQQDAGAAEQPAASVVEYVDSPKPTKSPLSTAAEASASMTLLRST